MTFACDIVDLAGLFSKPVSLEELILRSRLGLEVRLMNTFDFRAGLNSGYLSFGFTFDFQIFTIDLLYATHEYQSFLFPCYNLTVQDKGGGYADS